MHAALRRAYWPPPSAPSQWVRRRVAGAAAVAAAADRAAATGQGVRWRSADCQQLSEEEAPGGAGSCSEPLAQLSLWLEEGCSYSQHHEKREYDASAST